MTGDHIQSFEVFYLMSVEKFKSGAIGLEFQGLLWKFLLRMPATATGQDQRAR